MFLMKIYANWCPHCKAMENDWNILKKKLPSHIEIVEIEDNEIHKLQEFNNKYKYNVKVNGYPTIVKIVNGKTHYYNGPRMHNNMYKWVNENIKNRSTFKKKKKRKRRTIRRRKN